MTVLFEPADAIAAGICQIARTIAEGRTTRHPRPCGWCEYTPDELRTMVDGFNAWAGYDDRNQTYARHECRVWQDLKPSIQEALVLVAQAFPELEQPAPRPELTPAPPTPDVAPLHVEEETPAWLR